MRKILAGVVAALALQVAPVLAPLTANADPGCQSEPWGFLGSQRRTICDGPTRPDGSWDRTRTIWWPSYWVRGWCSGSAYYMSCTPGYWMPPGGNQETYPVTADTVLPDEPGHLSGIGV